MEFLTVKREALIPLNCDFRAKFDLLYNGFRAYISIFNLPFRDLYGMLPAEESQKEPTYHA